MGMTEPEYFAVAREHEAIFRAALQHMKDQRIDMVPKDLDPTAPLEEILTAYQPSNETIPTGAFAIGNFQKTGQQVRLYIKNFAVLSGSGVELRYRINPDNSLTFEGYGPTIMSMC